MPEPQFRSAVTFLCDRYWPDQHGGVETHMWHFTRQLAGWCEAGRPIAVQVLTENRTSAPPQENLMPGLTVYRYPKSDPGWRWRWWPLVRLRWWRARLRAHDPRGPIWAGSAIAAAAAILAGYRDQLIYNPPGCIAACRYVSRIRPHITSMQVSAGVPALGRRSNCNTILTASDEIIDHGQTGFVFDDQDPADLAQWLSVLHRDPAQRSTMAAAARRAAQKQTWRLHRARLGHLSLDQGHGASW